MAEWDGASIGLILVGCSIIAAGIIIAAVLLGFLHAVSQFMLLTAIFLIVMGAAVVLFMDRRSGQDT